MPSNATTPSNATISPINGTETHSNKTENSTETIGFGENIGYIDYGRGTKNGMEIKISIEPAVHLNRMKLKFGGLYAKRWSYAFEKFTVTVEGDTMRNLFGQKHKFTAKHHGISCDECYIQIKEPCHGCDSITITFRNMNHDYKEMVETCGDGTDVEMIKRCFELKHVSLYFRTEPAPAYEDISYDYGPDPWANVRKAFSYKEHYDRDVRVRAPPNETDPYRGLLEVFEMEPCCDRGRYDGRDNAPKCIEYRGTRSSTGMGHECKSWASNRPDNPEDASTWPGPEAGLDGNYCRNPGNLKERSWCFITERKLRWDDPQRFEGGSWEYCAVPDCGHKVRSLLKRVL